MSNEPQRPTTDDAVAWKRYWMTSGQPWRTKPEIGADRQAFLARRLLDRPQGNEVDSDIYPFKGITLDRADVEWLLANQDQEQWSSEWHLRNEGGVKRGLDLRGAILSGVDLDRLPLYELRGGLDSEEWFENEPAREPAAIHLEHAVLFRVRLQGSEMRSAHLEGADLRYARLEGVTLRGGHLEGADLRYAFFDRATALNGVVLGDRGHGFVRVADARWDDVDLAVVDWSVAKQLRDDREARRARTAAAKKNRKTRLEEYQAAVRANRQLATRLREQGLNEAGDRFAYRAQVLQRQVFRRQGLRKWPAYLGSLILCALACYGYRPVRSFLTHLAAIIWFATVYHDFGLPSLDAVI